MTPRFEDPKLQAIADHCGLYVDSNNHVASSKEIEFFAEQVRRDAIEACAKVCYEFGMDELKNDLARIKDDVFTDPDYGKELERDFDSDDVSLNDEHPRTLAENAAKSQAFMFMSLEKKLKDLK